MSVARKWRTLLLWTAVLVVVLFVVALLAERGTFVPTSPEAEAGGNAIAAGAAGHSIAGRIYLDGTKDLSAPLVVVLHGDAPFHKPGYHYFFASQLAKAVPGTSVAALLRPGYEDPYGARSNGDRGFAVGENYTHAVVDDVAAAIGELRVRLGARAVILVGHSGGAAIAADIAALYPGLVQHAVLVGCPCDVPSFRLHMARLQWGPMWLLPVQSVSPLDTLSKLNKGVRITAISGAEDPIALPRYAQDYVAGAQARGIAASMIVIPGKGHEVLNEPEVIEGVAKAVREER